MYKSIIYKEWIKTRRVIALMALLFVGLGVWSFLKINEECRISGMVNLWETLLQKGVVFFAIFRFAPLFLGAMLAITQYVPELHSKRLKLTLHLPLPERHIIATMLLFGLSATLVFVVVSLAALLGGLSIDFPREIVGAAFQLILPWFLAAPAVYLLASWVCLEPLWKQRVLNFLVAVAAIAFFFFDAKAGAYLSMNLWLVAAIILAFLFPFYSTLRFKEGK
jgi:hypothetical protein